MSVLRARRRAERLVVEHGEVSGPPVDVAAIARRLQLRVVKAPLGGDISGLLVTRSGVSTARFCCAGKKPGTRMFTRTFFGAHSRARFLLRLCTAALVAE